MADAEGGPAQMIVTLCVACLVSGVALVGANEMTAPRIERNRAEALERAVYEVLPGAVRREPFVLVGDRVEPLPERGREADAVWAGYDASDRRVGFAIPAEGGGFQDTIRLIFGVEPETRRLVGMRVLESKETPGLGDKIIKDDSFVQDFDGVAADPAIEATRKGATQPFQVDAICGATISSKAVVSIINGANTRWLDRLPGAGKVEGR